MDHTKSLQNSARLPSQRKEELERLQSARLLFVSAYPQKAKEKRTKEWGKANVEIPALRLAERFGIPAVRRGAKEENDNQKSDRQQAGCNIAQQHDPIRQRLVQPDSKCRDQKQDGNNHGNVVAVLRVELELRPPVVERADECTHCFQGDDHHIANNRAKTVFPFGQIAHFFPGNRISLLFYHTGGFFATFFAGLLLKIGNREKKIGSDRCPGNSIFFDN